MKLKNNFIRLKFENPTQAELIQAIILSLQDYFQADTPEEALAAMLIQNDKALRSIQNQPRIITND